MYGTFDAQQRSPRRSNTGAAVVASIALLGAVLLVALASSISEESNAVPFFLEEAEADLSDPKYHKELIASISKDMDQGSEESAAHAQSTAESLRSAIHDESVKHFGEDITAGEEKQLDDIITKYSEEARDDGGEKRSKKQKLEDAKMAAMRAAMVAMEQRDAFNSYIDGTGA